MKKNFSNIGNTISKFRTRKNMSQIELSNSLGYKNGQFVSNIERGCCNVPLEKINLIAELLDVPVETIVRAMVKDYKIHLNTMLSVA